MYASKFHGSCGSSRRSVGVPRLLRGAGALLAALLVLAGTRPALAQRCTPVQLLQPNSVLGNGFGSAVAIDGGTMLIGAVGDTIGPNAGQGSAHVYRWTGAGWTHEALLSVCDGQLIENFGASVAIDGDTAIIGAPGRDVGVNQNQGVVYVFVRSPGGTDWSLQDTLTADDGSASDLFGGSIAISGDTLVASGSRADVGANVNQGAAYVFVRSGGAWVQQDKLTAGDGEAEDRFAQSVGIDGDTVVVGASADDVGVTEDLGSAYVFVRNGTDWSEQAKLVAPDGGAASVFFGTSVAIDGDTIALASAGNSQITTLDGSVWIFTRTGTEWSDQARLSLPADAFPFVQPAFGSSVALEGDTAVVGASNDDVDGLFQRQGSAYVFVRSGTVWTRQARLLAPERDVNDRLGASVAISGDTALIGAPKLFPFFPENGPGSAWVFSRAGTAWIGPDMSILATDTAPDDQFARSVAVAGNTAIIGSPIDDRGVNWEQGSAFIFVRIGTTWIQQDRLWAADGAAADSFGTSVAISGDTVVIGARLAAVGANFFQGAAYVFVRAPGTTTWTQQAKLVAADGAEYDALGDAVAISGNTAIVGASSDNVNTVVRQGSAYVFVRSGTAWTEQAKLVAADGAENDFFGRTVAISGNTALVSSELDDIGTVINLGSAYVFVRSGTSWTQQAKLVAADGSQDDGFGVSVAVESDTAIVGSINDDVGLVVDQGSAYVFVRSGGGVWTQQAKLVASDGQLSDRFGISVDISSETVIVGADGDDMGSASNQGSAYVFVRSGTSWTQQAKVVASDGVADDRFGTCVAIDGGTAVVGGNRDGFASDADIGSAYAFVRSGSVWSQQAELTAKVGSTGDTFGYSIAIDGDAAVVGAPNVDFGAAGNQGAAYVFERAESGWVLQDTLIASDGAAGDEFGTSVAISGNTVVVGAVDDDIGANSNQGSAYVFVRAPGAITWTQQAKLTATGGAALDLFGTSVAVSGDTALVGAPNDDIGVTVDRGSAYVFVRDGTVWTQQAQLTAAAGAFSDRLGNAVALDGNTAVVGASLDNVGANADQGSAVVFVRSGIAWTEQATLTASDGAAADLFGYSASISGDTALIGARFDDVGANVDQGAAYVFIRTGSVWTQQAKLSDSEGAASDVFGSSVWISNDMAVVGAPFDDVGANSNQGSACVFVRSGGSWSQSEKLTAPDGAAGYQFGQSVAVSGGLGMVGAHLSNVGSNTNQGSARSFDLAYACPGFAPPIDSTCLGDYNRDLVIDLTDLLEFLSGWLSTLGQPGCIDNRADYNRDLFIDLTDLLDFFSDWLPTLGQTCP